MCVCVCVWEGGCVRACVCTLLLLSIFLVFEWFLAPCFIYVNDKPESKFLYTETIKLDCIVFNHQSNHM